MLISKEFKQIGNNKLAIVICGYRGKIKSYGTVIESLTAHSFDVVAYEYPPSFLNRGDPDGLGNLVRELHADIAQRLPSYESAICTGVSIGGGLGLSIQFRFPKVTVGLYAGAGTSPADTVFDTPFFYGVRRRFVKHGYRRAELKEAWKDFDITPDMPEGTPISPILVYLGSRDRIVNHAKALHTYEGWKKRGIQVQTITMPGLGHYNIIKWYKSNFNSLLLNVLSIENPKR